MRQGALCADAVNFASSKGLKTMNWLRVCAVGVLSVLSLSAQVVTGRITGRITDSSGAVVQKASVKTRNVLTNVETSTVSTSDGIFDLLNLIPGQYRLEVEMAGFKRHQQGPHELRVGDSLTIDIILQLGSQTESVTVTAEAALLESTSASSGKVVDSRRLENLPLPASNPLVTTMMVANMTMMAPPTNTLTPDANNQVTQAAAAGTRQGQSMISIDGMPSMQGGTATGIVPPPEILQEVKVSTAPYDASLGHFTGAQVNMVTKSGTNGFHGSMVFWNTNTSLNALSYFSKRSINDPATGPVTHDKIRSIVPYISFNRYRGTVGGPLVIPWLYNGRNKTFWQYAGDYFFMPYSTNGFFTVPTAKQRQGDFSDLLALGAQYQLYDPYSGTLGANGVITRRPLAGNIIPSNQLSPVAQKLLRYFPLPNTPGTSNGLQNYTGAPNSSIDMAQHFGRVDQVISPNNRMFVSYNRYCLYALQTITFGKPLGDIYPTGGIQANCHQGGTLDDVITPAPNWILDFRYGFVRFQAYRPHTSLGVDLSSLGMSPQLINEIQKDRATHTGAQHRQHYRHRGSQRLRRRPDVPESFRQRHPHPGHSQPPLRRGVPGYPDHRRQLGQCDAIVQLRLELDPGHQHLGSVADGPGAGILPLWAADRRQRQQKRFLRIHIQDVRVVRSRRLASYPQAHRQCGLPARIGVPDH